MGLKLDHDFVLDLLASILLIVSLIVIGYQFVVNGEYYYFLWYTNFASIVLAVGVIVRNDGVCGSVAYTSSIGEFLWIADFVLYMLGRSMGRVTGIFNYPLPMIVVSIILHMLLVFLGIYYVVLNGYSRYSIWYSTVLFKVLLLPATYGFTFPKANVNCIYHPCDMTYQEALNASKSYLGVEYLMYYISYWTMASVLMHLVFFYTFRYFDNLAE